MTDFTYDVISTRVVGRFVTPGILDTLMSHYNGPRISLGPQGLYVYVSK